MGDGFRDSLDRLLTASAQPLDRWLLPYRQRLPAASRGESAQPAFATLADWFEHQVRCTPQATALVGGQQRLNYRHLN